jgi:hypothetical protein
MSIAITGLRIGPGLGAFLLALPALGSPNYAPEIQARLSLGAPPSCTICHATELGGDNTVNKPFGVSIQRLGAAGDNDLGALRRALSSADEEATDSDGDGVTDLDELRDGSDPNRVDREPPMAAGGAGGESGFGGEDSIPDPPDPSGPVPDLPIPQTGCALKGGNASRHDGGSLFWLLVALCAAAVRRHRRSVGARRHGAQWGRHTLADHLS